MSMFFGNRLNRFKMAPEDDKGSNNGGAAGKDDKKDPPANDYAKEIADLRASNAAMMQKIEAMTGKKESDDESLHDKAKKQREADDKASNNHKAIESALKFSLKSEEFLKTNQSLLPKDIGDIFKAADKENYASPIEKDGAIKAGLIQSFFSVQSNLDLLTQGQKIALDDYLKLTKNSKQDKAQQIYDSIFEPTFDQLRRLKKAEALAKGHGGGSDSEDAYKNKMINLSKKHYLGEKSNA